MRTRKDYVTMIWIYEKRRKELRESTSKRLKQMREKISVYNKRIRDIDKRNEVIAAIIKLTNDFFNVDIGSKSQSASVVLARYSYYKAGLEMNIPNVDGTHLSEAIGREKKEAFRRRIYFTRSFKTKPENKKAYHDFKKYLDKNL